MLTIHYIPQGSDPFSPLVEDLLRNSSRVGETHTSHAQGYTTITYQGPEGYWNPLDDCDNGDSGVWVFARIEDPETFCEGEALNFSPVSVRSADNPFGSYAVSAAKAKNMTFWLLQAEGEHYLAIDDRMFNTHNRRVITFISSGEPAVSAVKEAVKPVVQARKEEKNATDPVICAEPQAEAKPVIQAPEAERPFSDFLFCRMCGKKIPGDSRFCMYCGVAVIRV